MSSFCQQCQTLNAANAKVCRQCHQPLGDGAQPWPAFDPAEHTRCERCSASVVKKLRFCNYCGHAMPAEAVQSGARDQEDEHKPLGMVDRVLAFARASVKGQGGRQGREKAAASARNTVRGGEGGMNAFLPFALQTATADAAYADTVQTEQRAQRSDYKSNLTRQSADSTKDSARGSQGSGSSSGFAHRARRVAVRTTVAADERLRAFLNQHRSTGSAFEDTKVIPDENGALPPAAMPEVAPNQPTPATAATAEAGPETQTAMSTGPVTEPMADEVESNNTQFAATTMAVGAAVATAATAAGTAARSSKKVDRKHRSGTAVARGSGASVVRKRATAARTPPWMGKAVAASAVVIALAVVFTGGRQGASVPDEEQTPAVVAVAPPQAESAPKSVSQVAVPSVVFMPEAVDDEMPVRVAEAQPSKAVPAAPAAVIPPATKPAPRPAVTAVPATTPVTAPPTVPATASVSAPAATVAAERTTTAAAPSLTVASSATVPTSSAPERVLEVEATPAKPAAAAQPRNRPKPPPQRNTLQDIQQRNAQLRRELGLSQ